MQSNYFNPYQAQCIPQGNPNAVNINIIAPQAYGSSVGATCPIGNNNEFYSLYGQNPNPNLPLYPQNYNNLALQQNYYPNQNGLVQNPYMQNAIMGQGIQQPQQTQYTQTPQQMNTHQGFATPGVFDSSIQNANSAQDLNNQAGMSNSTNLIEKTTSNETNSQNNVLKETKTKTKKVVPLTDDYIKSLENYMNNENPKIRLIGAKEVLERFKEDENRKDNPSLMPLLNKALRDSSPSVRFLALTALQLGYAVGNNETVTILKEIQSQNADKIGEDALLASEILLNMSQGQKIEVPMTQNEIEKENKKQGSK